MAGHQRSDSTGQFGTIDNCAVVGNIQSKLVPERLNTVWRQHFRSNVRVATAQRKHFKILMGAARIFQQTTIRENELYHCDEDKLTCGESSKVLELLIWPPKKRTACKPKRTKSTMTSVPMFSVSKNDGLSPHHG